MAHMLFICLSDILLFLTARCLQNVKCFRGYCEITVKHDEEYQLLKKYESV